MFQLLRELSEPSAWVQGEKIGPAQVSRYIEDKGRQVQLLGINKHSKGFPLCSCFLLGELGLVDSMSSDLLVIAH